MIALKQNKIKNLVYVICFVLLFVIVPFLSLAQFNPEINYQGKLTNSSGSAVTDGDYNMRFWLIASSTAATTSAVWSEEHIGANKVQVNNGLFSVMLGSLDSLSGVDFNQTLYLGVEIGGTGSPAWDGEMSPRKILGTVPSAFVAEDANTLAGLATTSFLRADEIDTMQATSSSALLTLIQNGAGKIMSLFSGVTEVFTALSNGNIGIATTTPSSKLTVIGNTYLGGNLSLTGSYSDSVNATGTSGQILSSTGTSTQWKSTSALGLGDGTFLGLTDTPSSYTANRLIFTNSGATALTDSANLVFDGTNLGIGTTTPGSALTVSGNISVYDRLTLNDTDFNSALGYQAGKNIVSGAQRNTFLGYQAGYSSSTVSANLADNNVGIGYRSLYSNTTGYQNTAIGGDALSANTSGVNNTSVGKTSLYSNTSGSYNTSSGFYSMFSNTTGTDNAANGSYSLYSNTTGNSNTALGNYSLRYNIAATSSVAVGLNAARGTNNYQNQGGVYVGYQAGYSASSSSDYNTMIGYQSGYGVTTGARNILLGYNAGYSGTNLTTGSDNIIIGNNIGATSTSMSKGLNIGNLIFGTSLDGTGTTLSTGNVGIGTSTPIGRLEVANNTNGGNVSYLSNPNTGTGAYSELNIRNANTSDTYSDGLRILTLGTGWTTIGAFVQDGSALMSGSNLGGGMSLATLNASANMRFYTGGFNDANERMRITSGGLVGIGTTSPVTTFAVNGSTTITSNLQVNGGTLFADATNNRVGIGTTTPSVALTVSGNISVYDRLTLNDTDSNSALGYQAGKNLVSDAQYNTFLGYQAGYSSSTASTNAAEYNTIIGYQAFYSNTTGSYNTANGESTLYFNTTGSRNTANGVSALYSNTTGSNNTANGNNALWSNTVGSGNSAFGVYSLYNNESGVNNTVVGYSAGDDIADGSYNASTSNSVFLGYDTRALIDGGINEVVIGAQAIGAGSNSVTLGSTTVTKTILQGNIGIATTTPSHKLTVIGNTYLGGNLSLTGSYSDSVNATGTSGQILSSTGTSTQWKSASSLGLGDGTFLGLSDTQNSFTANRLIFTDSGATSLTDSANLTFDGTNLGLLGTTGLLFGGDALLSRGAANRLDLASGDSFNIVSGTLQMGGNTVFYSSTTNFSTLGGYQAGTAFNSSALANTAFGYQAITTATSSDYNTAFGHQALRFTTSGFANTAVGYQVLDNNTTGFYNTAMGGSALGNNTTGSHNLAIGVDALIRNVTGSHNIGLGYQAMYFNDTASTTIAIGDYSAYGIGGVYNNQGGVYLGYRAGYSASSSSDYNTMIGYQSGYGVTTGARNILLGYNAGYSGTNLTTGSDNIIIGNNIGATSTAMTKGLNIGNLIFGTSLDGAGTTLSSGNVGIGTSTPVSRLSIEKLSYSSAGTAGINQYFTFNNSVASAVQYGNFGYLYATNTATTTIAGNMFKIEDSTLFGNTIRGFEVQTDRGTNTLGENTALSGFARTFGVRGTTQGDAGGTYEPAGVFGETAGTTQGNAIRAYSSSITTASLLKLFQASSTFAGTGLLMNFGNSGGSFSSTTASKFIDLQNAGTSMFTVGAYGKLTIGDGTTNNNAGIQVGYGGICVDNDGSCNASTTGRVSAVSYHTGNSDLAEMYFSGESLKTGEVVYVKGGLSVGKADNENKDKIIGVVSTKPGQVLGFDDTSLKINEKGYPIALAGRVPVRLSNENGAIKAGDELMLSSIPGVVMKASSTGKIIGTALEDFNETRAYSDTYINQFGDDLVDPVFIPINKDKDPRINDGCYFGGGNASGEEPCVPLKSLTKDEQIKEAEAIAKREAEERELAKLAKISSESIALENGKEVKVGQIVMFVDLRQRYLDEVGAEMVTAMTAKASTTKANEVGEETVWQRVVNLANNFVDGVLSVFTLKADRVEVKDQLCVDGVCLNADDLRNLLKNKEINQSVDGNQSNTLDEEDKNINPDNNNNSSSANSEEDTFTEIEEGNELDTNNENNTEEDSHKASEVLLESEPLPSESVESTDIKSSEETPA